MVFLDVISLGILKLMVSIHFLTLDHAGLRWIDYFIDHGVGRLQAEICIYSPGHYIFNRTPSDIFPLKRIFVRVFDKRRPLLKSIRKLAC